MMFIFIFLITFFQNTLFGQIHNNSYIIKNISIEKTDTSSNKAKDQALLDAQLKAFDLLLKRMIQEDELSKIPKNLTPQDISPLILSFSIISEKTTSKTYSAILSYEFTPSSVKDFFEKYSVNYTENFIPDILILPLIVDGANIKLWEEGNIWMGAWKKNDDFNSNLSYKLPLGDFSDLSTLNANDAFSQNREKLDKIADKYNVRDILICILNIQKEDINQTISNSTVDIVHYETTGQETLRYPSLSKHGSLSPEEIKIVKHDTISNIWDVWKKQGNLISHQTQEILCNIMTDDLKIWQDIKKRLDTIRIIKNTKLLTLSKGMSQISFTFGNDIDILKQEFERVGLDLSENASQWYLKIK